ncbi:MAG: flippase-like domain-containing protein [Desulfobulbaceae bacterium]|nr:flippase-like domain-containing protein [Desulfobulbaceae bacterium]
MTTSAKSPLANLITALTGWRGLLLVLGMALAWQALRGMAWNTAWAQLSQLSPGALLILLVLNLVMLPLMTARWWLLLRTLGSPVRLLTACAYRLAANAVSYLTPGPHFGGEPLLVYLLHQRQQIPLPTAVISVALDRMLELWASIVILSLSLLILTASDNGPFTGGWALPLAVSMLVVLAALLTALFTGRHPLSRLVSWLKRLGRKQHSAPTETAGSWLEAIMQGEVMAESLLHRHQSPFLLANLYSLAHWLGVLVEFWLMAAFLGQPLSFFQLLTVVITARLAFLTPLPAGLGVLESALPWVTAALGLGSVLGLSLCLLIRFRDILFSLAGLGLAMKYLTCPGKASTVAEKAG